MSNLLSGSPALASTGGWTLGLVIGFSIVVVVVVLVSMILTYAHRIAEQASTGIGGMGAAFDNTETVWALRDINRSTTGIWRSAQAARKVLGG